MKRRFFTLMEVMIAVAIFTMVALALFGFSSGVTRSWEKITLERNRFNELLVVDRALDAIFSNAIPFMWREMDNGLRTEKPFVVAGPETLRSATIHRLNDSQEGALRFVELFVEDGELRAVYSPRPFMDWEGIDPSWCTVSVLATGVESIAFSYADWSSDVSEDWENRLFWRDEWETEDSNRKDIPLAIMATVNWEDGRNQTWIRRTVGNSFRERYGTYTLPADNLPQ